jgi:nitrogenase molybdenum-iron protein alpha/beta subunit
MKPEKVVTNKSIAITLGRLHRMAETSEMRTFLHEAGIDEIIHLTDCRNIYDFYKMAHAKITIVMHPFGLPAAKYMEETYGIPYVVNFPSFDPDEIHSTYRKIGEILGTEIDDSLCYTQAKQALMRVAEKYKDKSFAVGEIISTDRSAFHSARTLLKYHIPVKYIYADAITAGKEEDIRWIAENEPETYMVPISDPNMLKILENPLPVDFAVGMLEDWYHKAEDTVWVNFDQEPQNGDYDSIRRLIEAIGGAWDEESV